MGEASTAERILVVDDNAVNRRMLAAILERSGYEIAEARDGEEALEKASRFPPDLVLLDIVMPKRDGFEVCNILKERDQTRDVPIIFLSAKTEVRDKIKGLEAGGTDYITKPFSKGEVLARVRNQLRIRSLTRELIQVNQELVRKQKSLDEDLKAAAGIQRSLLPQNLPDLKNVSMSWKFLPSELIGGDIFNVLRLDADHAAIYMLDVSGHGVPSALVTVSVSQMLQIRGDHLIQDSSPCDFSPRIASPGEVLASLDREYPMERFDKFFTIVYMILDLAKGELVYSNGGHPPPLLMHLDGTVEYLEKGGTIIGLGGVLPFEQGKKSLKRGDRIILYTDGLLERRSPRGGLYGKQRFYESLIKASRAPLETMLDQVFEAVLAFGGPSGPEDDLSLLGIELHGKG